MLLLPQRAKNQRKLSFKTKPNQKDWQKLSFPTPIWENSNYEHKTHKNIYKDQNQLKELKITLEMLMEWKTLEFSWVLM